MKVSNSIMTEKFGELQVTGWAYGNQMDGIQFELEDATDEYESSLMYDLGTEDIQNIENVMQYELDAMFG